MLNVVRCMVDWLTVEVRSITHEMTVDGRSLSNFHTINVHQ
ncbi:hypothetical protein SAMN04488137_0857 [Fictibacillus solisalsi]|uniref:Uncharacterized protein n=1 Tax=Fictibacillus solisalsi TaxID=459525 RepID=A0A1G9UDI4_9BACL|nr:hypothetical protein [Fictibacillus solisalsi]SDM57883.1 hypothetical protein SAMN04488137_0857 [Fictibacillus solisalsi]